MSSSERRNTLIRYLRNIFTEDNEGSETTVNREVILRLLNRVQNVGSSNINEDSDSETNTRRHYFFEEPYSSDNYTSQNTSEEYIDFRTYPIPIDWAEVENEKSIAYKIFDKYGLFGIGLFSGLEPNEMKITFKKFEISIVEYYNMISSDSKKANEFVERLPKLSQTYIIMHKKLFNKKELILIKIYLDILEHYYRTYDKPCYNVIKFYFRIILINIYQQL